MHLLLESKKVFKRKNGELLKNITSEQLGIHGKAFYRGLKYLGNNKVLIGIGAWTLQFAQADRVSPVQIIELDLKSETVLGRIVLSNDKNTSIHGLDAF